MGKTITVDALQENCLRIINEMGGSGESMTITNRGRPVAVLSPAKPERADRSIIGAMKGSVLAYDDPFGPAADPSEWECNTERGHVAS